MALDPRYAFLTETPIAHRGLHDMEAGVPENTLPAFEAAIAKGHPIELDVQRTKDNQLVVFHDYDLKRAAGRADRIRRMTAQQLADVPVFGSSHTIPSLQTTLSVVDGHVPLLIEFKPTRKPDRIARLAAEALRDYRGLYAVQSFDPHLVRALKNALPDPPAGQISGALRGTSIRPFDRIAARYLLHMTISRPDFVNYELAALPNRWVQTLTRTLGLPLLVWTVRTDADRRQAEALITNYVFDQAPLSS